MSVVAVTGGTGTLGRRLVPALLARGHRVRVVSRRRDAVVPPGADVATANVVTGRGVEEMAAGTDVVVHAATSPIRRARTTEVEGTRAVAAAAAAAGAHLVYVSIVGVDRHRYPYYRAKLAAERIVEQSRGRWAIVRATQFHELLDQFLSAPLFPTTRDMSFQPVDAGEFAEHLAAAVDAGDTGRLADFAGPQVLSVRQLRDSRRSAVGRASVLVRVPAVGFVRDFDRGLQLAPERRDGTITWEQWLGKHRARPATGPR